MTPPVPRPLSCPVCAQRYRRATVGWRDLLHRAPLPAGPGRPVNRRLHWLDPDLVPLCADEDTA